MVSSVKSQPNHYETLGLTPSASDDDIAEAYAARINKYLVPPDEADASLRDEARQFMLAYRTLSDPSKRRAYDASLAPEPEPQGPPEARPDSEVAPFIAATPQGRMEEGPPDLSAWSDPNHRAEPAAEGQAEREDNEQSSAVAAQGYTLGYFARKHNLSREQARELMARVGNDREKLNEAAEQLKAAPEPSPAPEPSQPSELSAAPEPSQASELSAAPEPSQASELSAAPEPSQASELSATPEPSPTPPADRSDYAYHEQTRWAPAVDPSSEPRARRLPAAAKAGAALVGVGLVAVSALLLGGYLELPGSTPRQSAPPSLTTSADGSMATGNAMPQPTVPEQDMSQLPGGLDPTPLETVAPTGSETAPASAELAQSVQAMPPDAAVEKQPSGPAPSRAGQSADAPQARARRTVNSTLTMPWNRPRGSSLRRIPPPSHFGSARTAHPAAVAQATKYCIAYDNIVGSRVTPPRKCKTKGDWAREGVDVDKLLRVAPRLKPTAAAQATKYCIAYDNIVGSRVTPPRKCRTKRDWAKEGVDVDKLLKG